MSRRPRGEITSHWETHVNLRSMYGEDGCFYAPDRACPGGMTLTEFRKRAFEYGFAAEPVGISGQNSTDSNFRSEDSPSEFPVEKSLEDVQAMTARERRLHLEEQRRLEAREVVDGVLRKRAEKSSEGSRNNEHPAPALLAHYGMGTSQMSILEDLFKTVQGQQRMIAELYEKIDGLAETVAEAQPKRNTCVFTQGNQMEQFCETHQTWTFARHDRCYHGREESGR